MNEAARDVVTIEAIGHRGDGIVTTAGGPLYVPFALPGERIVIARDGARGRVVEILEPSPERVAPICRHFGTCGGCALQMLPLDATRKLKRDFVVAVLKQRGLDVAVEATVGAPVASRRRAVMTALRSGNRLVLGYHERLTHNIVDIEECPVLAPPLQGRLADIRAIAELLVRGKKPARLTVLFIHAGLDLSFDGVQAPDARGIAKLAETGAARGLARPSVGGEPVVTLAEPSLEIAGVVLTPPPSVFVQASAQGETAMTALVTEHLAGTKRVADLFSGLGTFALALARDAQVHAVETNGAALDALTQATRRAAKLKPIDTETRDLFADPLSPKELEKFYGVVFDPPFAGAKTQAEALAASKVPRIAAISCNPATFARDARILVNGGYRLTRVVPIDQFVYSAETEVVGLFSRD
jgi:23S rRNA (uracil1939-C5)-methyltransferase